MLRYWAIALMVLVAATTGFAPAGGKGGDFKVTGKFTKDDPKDQQRGGPSQTHVVKMKAGQVYTIDMVSNELDSYLRLLDNKGTQLDEDDDSGGNLNARIIFKCSKDGDYKVVCTTFSAEMTGSYTLTIKSAVNTEKNTTSHESLIGKPAPDFRGDFAINGQPVTLSDLRGKVVLLDFWEVRSRAAVASLPVLSEWHKTYKADGLAIVGVTFYNAEIGQRVGFDKATGKVTQVEEATTRDTDRAMLKDFAAHHKLPYLVMPLPKSEALRTFEAYAVNGLPQFVLIDRNGNVQMVRTSDLDKSGGALESEIKKLLAEK
jgi:hypothetical protein